MSTLLQLGVGNALLAGLLALLAAVVSRLCKRPALAHGLWLLVLLKLVTPIPPLFWWHLGWLNAPTSPAVAVSSPPRDSALLSPPAEGGNFVPVSDSLEPPAPGVVMPARLTGGEEAVQGLRPPPILPEPAPPAARSETAPPPPPSWALDTWASLLGWTWAAGAVVWFLWVTVHLSRFRRLLRCARPAPAGVQAQAARLAQRLGLRRCPGVWLVPGAVPPMVWAGFGPARLFFPAELLERLAAEARGTLLAHELAHVRRRDHWVRWLELIVQGLYWWYPLVWWVRRQVHVHEEECCDAWVVAELPARTYAAAILETVDFLAETRRPLPLGASGLGHFTFLKRRLTMIMLGRPPKRLSAPGWVVLALGALLLPLVPTFAQPEQKPAEAGKDADATGTEQQPPARAAETAHDAVTFNANPVSLVGGASGIWSVAVAPDGRRLAVGSGGSDRAGAVTVWDLTTRKQVMVLPEPRGVASVAFSPNGRLLASTGWDRLVKVRDAGTGRVLVAVTLDGPARLAFAPDGKVLATATETGTLQLWDVTTGGKRADLTGEPVYPYYGVAFSSDGKTLAVGGGNGGGVGFGGGVGNAGSVGNTGGSASSGLNNPVPSGQVTLWDAVAHKQLRTMKGQTQRVQALAFTPDGKTVAGGSEDGTVRLWDAGTGRIRSTFLGYRYWGSLAFSPDGKVLAAGDPDQNTVDLFDPSGARQLGRVENLAGPVRSLAFTPDGKTLVAGGSGTVVTLVDTATQQPTGTLEQAQELAGPSPLVAAALSPDGKTVALAREDRSVQLRDAHTGELRRTLKGHEDTVTCLAFSPDGTTLATGSPDKTIKLWDPATGEERATLKGHSNWVYALAFAPNGKTLASGSYDRTVRLWDPVTGQERATLKGHTASVRALAYSPDGKVLASGGADQTVKWWDAATGAELITLKDRPGSVRALAFAPDGATLAVGRENGAGELWDAARHTLRATLKGQKEPVMALAFSPHGQTLVTGSVAGVIRVWDPATGDLRGTLRGHADSVSAVLIGPDGQEMVSASLDRTVKRWQPGPAGPAGAGAEGTSSVPPPPVRPTAVKRVLQRE